MRKIYFAFIGLFVSLGLLAQAPQKLSYQAVVRDSESQLVRNQEVSVEIIILADGENGTPVFSETHMAMTNENGLFTVEIGTGNVSNGDFSNIDWSHGTYFLQSGIDPAGGTSYSISGTSPILSVPYALHANTADSLTGFTEADPVFISSVAASISTEDTTRWGQGLVLEDLPDNSASNELQVLSISNDTLFLSDGGFVKIPYGPGTAENGDLLSFDGENWVAKHAIIQNTGGNLPVNNMQPFQALNFVIALQGIFPSRSAYDPFIAEIMIFAGNFAPRGWAFCNGQLMPISQYTALFSLVGTIYGGDGRTTFALPDLRGRVPMHFGQGPGLTSRTIGEKGGAETSVLSVSQLPAHSHTITYE